LDPADPDRLETHHQQTTGSGARSITPSKIRARDAKVETLAAPVEQLVIAFEPGLLTFTWDKTTSRRPGGEEIDASRFRGLADYALVDQTGKMSVLGIFQHIWVPSFRRCNPRCTCAPPQRQTH